MLPEIKQPKSMPMVPQISSLRQSDPDGLLDVPSLNSMLSIKLKGAVIKEPHPDLIKSVFPTTTLPFPLDSNLLSLCWKNPPIFFQEVQYAKWMNSIGASLKSQTGHRMLRKWDASHSTTLLEGSSIRCKPDIILTDIYENKWNPEWWNI
jgi:hypothetical protein